MEKSVFTAIVIILFTLCAKAQDVTVNLSNLRSDNGVCIISLYKGSKGFIKEPQNTFKTETVKIKNAKATFSFSNIPNGNYAISVIHDENDNGKMDLNFFGKPKEGFGASNNKKGFLGPPSYDDCKFEVKNNRSTHNIIIRYL